MSIAFDVGDAVLAWCMEHNDVAWLFTDGSGSCFFTCIVETGSGECRLKKLPKRVQTAIAAVRDTQEDAK